MISSTLFCCLVCKIVCKEKSDYYIKLITVNALQLAAEIYLITFFANMIIYLLYEFIIQYFISELNLTIKYAEKKVFMHLSIYL